MLNDGGAYVDLLPGFYAEPFDALVDNAAVNNHSNLEIVNEGCYGDYQCTDSNTSVNESDQQKLEPICDNKN